MLMQPNKKGRNAPALEAPGFGGRSNLTFVGISIQIVYSSMQLWACTSGSVLLQGHQATKLARSASRKRRPKNSSNRRKRRNGEVEHVKLAEHQGSNCHT